MSTLEQRLRAMWSQLDPVDEWRPVLDEAIAALAAAPQPAPVVNESLTTGLQSSLRAAAQAVLDRWDSPWDSLKWTWAKQSPTADLMADLRRALDAQPAQEPTKEQIAEIVRQHLTETYICTRVWNAWNVGTMTQKDFEDAAEGPLAEEIADSLMPLFAQAAWSAAPTQAAPAMAAERERCAKLRRLLQVAEVLFAPLCRDATAWNWLDETRAALAESEGPNVEPSGPRK